MVTVLSTFGQVALVNESWNDVAVLQIEVVVGTVDVCGDHTGEHAAILLMVCPNACWDDRRHLFITNSLLVTVAVLVLDINQSLSISVAEV